MRAVVVEKTGGPEVLKIKERPIPEAHRYLMEQDCPVGQVIVTTD